MCPMALARAGPGAVQSAGPRSVDGVDAAHSFDEEEDDKRMKFGVVRVTNALTPSLMSGRFNDAIISFSITIIDLPKDECMLSYTYEEFTAGEKIILP